MGTVDGCQATIRLAGIELAEVPSLAEIPLGPEAVVSRWIDCFNLRDLDGMLACMSREVRFYPLRLSGLKRCYRGHDGVREWFARLNEVGHTHRLGVHNLRAEANGEVVAVGELHLEEGADPARFWARDQVEDGRIVVAHHYLTDPAIFESIAEPQRHSRPPRFPGL
jgi:ketosteroid isomerase-like protein